MFLLLLLLLLLLLPLTAPKVPDVDFVLQPGDRAKVTDDERCRYKRGGGGGDGGGGVGGV
jgi:hypothetical protein